MSVANEFTAISIRFSEEQKRAYIANGDINLAQVFPYTIMCKADGLCMLFDLNRKVMAVIRPIQHSTFPNQNAKFSVMVTKFWIADDMPVPSVTWFQDQPAMMEKIKSEFQEKFAAYTLDGIINS